MSTAWPGQGASCARVSGIPLPVQGGKVCRTVSLVLVLGLAVTLLLSAALKSAAPEPTASAFLKFSGWTAGLSLGARVLLVDLFSAIEALVGAGLLFGIHRRWPLRVGAGAALLLLVVHGVLSWSSSGSCGCFGDREVPDGVVLTVLGLGLLGCALRLGLLGPTRSRISLGYLALTGLLAALALTPRLARPANRASPEQQLLTDHLIGQGWTRARILVAAANCDHCLVALRQAAAEIDPAPLCFVTRSDDPVRPAQRKPGVHYLTIPASLWWHLLESAPPRRLRLINGKVVPESGG